MSAARRSPISATQSSQGHPSCEHLSHPRSRTLIAVRASFRPSFAALSLIGRRLQFWFEALDRVFHGEHEIGALAEPVAEVKTTEGVEYPGRQLLGVVAFYVSPLSRSFAL